MTQNVRRINNWCSCRANVMLQNLHVSYGHCTPLQTDFSFTFPLQINSNNNNSLHVKNISSSSRMKNLAYCVYDKSKLLLINWLSLKQILCLTALFFLFLHSYLFVYGLRFYFDLSRLDWRIIFWMNSFPIGTPQKPK